jgi:imidazolonepropionase-like amidohydrolase
MLITGSRLRTQRRVFIAALLAGLALLFSSDFHAGAQNLAGSNNSQAIETGKFRLHKFAQLIGEESYEIARDGDSLIIRSSFKFTDRGKAVPLSATLRMRQDLTPERFEIKGSVSRFSTIDASVEINKGKAAVREGKEWRVATVPDRFFTLSGYAPVTMQMMLVRYLANHKIKGSIQTLPGGEVTVEGRGRDKVKVGDKEVELDRYSVSGLIWGRESLWLDSSQQLVAAVTVDAEFDHFEAIREGYESALPLFVSRAAEDSMAALAQLANQISPARKGALAITGGTLIDGTGKAPITDSVVIIEGDRITGVGPRTQVKIPQGATLVDARGKTLLPGLWDMHAHIGQVEWGPVYLAAGVTTVRDVGNEFEFITAVRDAIRQGRGLGPRLLLAGVVDGDSPRALGVIRANTPEEGRAVVNRYKGAGFEQIKIYSSIKPEVLAAITAEAHRLGMTVTGHVPEGMNAIQAIEAGMDQISHIQYLPPVMLPKGANSQSSAAPALDIKSAEAQQAIKFLKEHGTIIDPTLVIFEWILHPSDIPFASIEPGAAKLPRELSGPINNSGVPPASAPRARAILEQYLAVVGALHRAGIPIVAGTDQVVPGHSLRRELELYVKAGMTPMEAIQAATLVPARIMKLEREVGTIEAGKRADLIILEANPLEEISNIRKVSRVVAAGRIYECALLWQSVGFQP